MTRPARLFFLALGVACCGLPVHAAMAQAPAAPAAAPAAEAKQLTAIFIDVSGKVQWRAKDGEPWQDAKLKDEVPAGVEIRTGLRSRSALRVGQNATVLIDAGTMLTLPAVMQEGSTLRTTCAVKHGRADFKVDEVGMTNDFRVVTPSTTLAVRGTEFAVASGPLKQVEVVGARRNTINAIELRYALNNTVVQMSGASESSSSVQNPAHSAVVAASPAPPAAAAAPATSQAETVQTAASGPPPSQAGSSAQASAGNRATAKAAAASGTGSATSVVATIQAAVQLANQRTEQAIEYLMSLESEGAAVTAQADAIHALQQLAEARKAEADAALAAHEQHLGAALAQQGAADEAGLAFDGADSALAQHLAAFGIALGRGNGLMDEIRGELDGESPDRQRLLALAQDAHDALAEMNEAFASADGARVEMEGALANVDAAIAALDSGTREGAAAAIAAYEAALAALREAATDGSSAYERALTARAAAAQLEALSRQFANLAGTQAALAVGAQALAALAATDLELARAEAGLAAIREARESAEDDSRAAVLGQVEAIYSQIVAARAALSERLLVATGTVTEADLNRGLANASGQEVFDRIGDLLGGDALAREADASGARDSALQAHADASAAADGHAEAIAGAEAMVDDLAERNQSAEAIASEVAEGRAGIEASGADVRAALDALAGAAETGDRQSLLGSAGVLESLDALEGTLLALTARVADLESALDGAATSADLEPLQAQAAEAIRVLAAAAATAAAADQDASTAAERAVAAGEAASQVHAMVADLAARFGLSDSMVAAAARAAAASAAAAQGAAGEAAAARQLVDVLALLGRSSQMEQLASRLGELADRNGQLSSLASADLEAARAEVVHANERGAVAFGALTGRTALDSATVQEDVQTRLATLQEMSTSSSQLAAAMDGVERSAVDAETALASAVQQRIAAQAGEAAAHDALGLTRAAVQAANLAAAVGHASDAGSAAAGARTASGLAVGFAGAAGAAAADAVRFNNDAEALRPDVEKFGTSRDAFVAAVAAQRAAVEAADGTMSELKSQAEFYEGVASLLAGRAKTSVAALAAAGAADSRAQVMAIAAQLATSAEDARAMEQTATTNAGRLFGRSMRSHVERAQAAANAAAAAANAAILAANRATEHATTAQAVATGGPIEGGGSSP